MTGTTISHYQILEKLGEGGMGVVYKAQDTKLNRTVALKFLPPLKSADSKSMERFLQEARATSMLDHPNISVIHEIGDTDDGRSFICMGYYDGQTLKEKLETDPPDINASIDIVLQIAAGLERAHEEGIIHRDIKPGNIMITARGEVKIVDFGLAKLLNESGVTETGRGVGTLPYMSPEQLQGRNVDSRSDLYSLGIILYEMLTGRHPHEEEHYAALMYSIINTEPPPPSILNPAVPKEIDEIVLKLIEKSPEKRFKSATELIDQLEQAMDFEDSASGVPVPAIRPILRQPKIALIILLVILILSALSVPSSRNTFFKFAGLTTTPDEIHLAVLPLLNVGDDPENKAFNDGLVETLTSSLTMLQPQNVSYWVVSSSEVRQRNVTSAQDALREFKATHVLYGSTQPLPNRFRLTLNLVDTRTAHQISSRVLTVSAEHLHSLQDEAVRAVTDMLNIEGTAVSTFASYTGLTSDPESYELYLKGRGFLQNYQDPDNISRAIALFEEAIELDPEYTLAYAGLGEASWRMYNETRQSDWVETARMNSRRAMASDRAHPEVFITDGLIQNGTGDYDAAVQSYRYALDLDPVNFEAHIGLSAAHEQLGNIDEAEEILKTAIRLRPSYWAGYNKLGELYLNQGRFSDAIPQYEDVIDLIPNSSWGYSNLGVVYYYLDEHQKAIELFHRAVEIEPDYHIYSNLGTMHYFRSNFEESAGMYENALSIRDNDYSIWGFLAAASKWAGKDSSSVHTYYRRALELALNEKNVNPRDAQLLADIAGYQAALGQSDAALSHLDDAIRFAPDNFFIKASIGIVLEQLGERDRALNLIIEAVEGGYPLYEIENDPHLLELVNEPDFIRFKESFLSSFTE
jgi:serine/threonine protein kinase/Flp pilus assembly protein TadD